MEKTVAEEKDQYVETGDQVHLEKSGLGEHAGLDDSNVPLYPQHKVAGRLTSNSSLDMTTRRRSASCARSTIGSYQC